MNTNRLTQNRYTYVNGDPINLADPTGHILLECTTGEMVCTQKSPGAPPTPDGEATRVRDLERQAEDGDSTGQDLVCLLLGSTLGAEGCSPIPPPIEYVGPDFIGPLGPGQTRDPSDWCLVGRPVGTEGICGTPPEEDEYRNPNQVLAVLDYLATYGGGTASGASGAAQAATVSVTGYTTARGTTVLSYTRYRPGLAGTGNRIAPAGDLVVRTRWAGRAFVALQVGVAAFDGWRSTEGESGLYRVTYTAVKTAATTGGTVAGAWAGLKGGASVGSFFGPWGTAIGGGLGASAGGIVGHWVTDQAVDEVWEFSYERVNGQ